MTPPRTRVHQLITHLVGSLFVGGIEDAREGNRLADATYRRHPETLSLTVVILMDYLENARRWHPL
jgi:hypothetical protein